MKKTIEEATKIAVELSEHLDAKEQAMFIAGFQTCFQHQSGQMYSEEEVIKLLDAYRMQLAYGERVFKRVNEWFNLNKKK